MKLLIAVALSVIVSNAFAQSVAPPPPPIEEHHPISYWWWAFGVLIALGIGIGAYMLIKKDPRRDAID